VGMNVLEDLRRKAHVLAATGHWSKIHLILFSKAGFTPDLQAVAAAEGIRLVRAENMV
jgi:hypothetical protein